MKTKQHNRTLWCSGLTPELQDCWESSSIWV